MAYLFFVFISDLIHTTVFNKAKIFEIQIRTEESCCYLYH